MKDLFGQVEIEFQEPVARITDPETSHEAADDTRFKASKHRKMALIALYDFGSMTDYELADRTGLQQNSIGKRRLDCARAGLVEVLMDGENKVKRPAPSGSMSLVWVLTQEGREYTEENCFEFKVS